MATVLDAPMSMASAGVEDKAHAGQPGSGPGGQTCGACAWRIWQVDARGRRRLKCNLTDWDWTESTDIKPEDAACKYFD
ncbi:MAG TPA: hypothetical protein VMG58_18740 [Candidatus Sulfotelmatobacter sp.]|nr:hypothetical protein [Candidatus Sulfotelmatobacter sp.]